MDRRQSRQRIRAGRRGSTMVESALAGLVYLLLLVSIAEFARLGVAYTLVSFSAQRAARFAAVRGSGSGHAASSSDITAEAQSYITALDNTQLTVTTTWTPDNHPGSTVKVKVAYAFRPILIPMSSTTIGVSTSCQQIITQ